MKIRAVRLREVGRFRAPIALEGLSGGLDVLAGPNELGKSTILKAIRRTLAFKHTSKDKDLEALRPYSGGAPMVEIDFEIDGKSWRIRKQFLSARSAELKDLSSGTVLRGADADAELSRLLAGDGGLARRNLLWVEQKGSLAPVQPDKAAGQALLAAIEGEVENVADGGVARAVTAQAKEALAELVTGHSKPRPAGCYKQALEELRLLEQQCAEARSRRDAAEARLQNLQQVRERIARLADPEQAAQRAKAATAAAQELAQARVAYDRCRQVEEGLRAQEDRVAALKTALDSLDGRIADLGKLEAAAAREAPELAQLEQLVADADVRAGDCRRRRDEIKAAVAAAEEERKALQAAARLAEVRERLSAARAAAAEHKALQEAIAENGADETLLAAIRREASSIATIRARLSVAAPAVSVAYARGGAGKITVGGRPLAEGETLSPTQPLVLHIAGIGTLTIAPGQSDGLAEDEADLAAHEETLGELLRRAGAASPDEAEHRAGERRGLVANLAESAAQLKVSAPNGVAALEQAEAELAAQAQSTNAGSHGHTAAALEERVQDLTEALNEAETVLAEATAAYAQAREALARLCTRVEERRARIETYATELGDASARAAKRKTQADALAAAEAERNGVVRDLAAWREAAPDAARFSALQEAAQAAEVVRSDAEKTLIELRRTEAGIEGALKSDRADDVEARLVELEETRARAGARVTALEEEIAALQLLKRELEAAASATRNHFAQPVIERLTPYLKLVFPDTAVRFGEGLALDGVERHGGREEINALSEGTQEQLAVLVRLAFARLMAESGAPVPLILDDALVYADDRRIVQMFEALKRAADIHQVLVLTCRERTFESLGGNRVAIGNWHPD